MLDTLFEQVITSGDLERFREITDSLELLVIRTNSFPDEVFQLILNLLSQKYFLELEESRPILYVLRSNFDLLSEPQKNEIFVALKNSYEKFRDWMSWFTISEIFGECFQNKQALQALCELKKIANEHPRSFIAHGLEHLAKSQDYNLAKSALDELLSLKNDPSERVQYEANLSLQRLKNQE
jgi:hypothetical protein